MTSHATEAHPYHQNEPHSKASETQPSLKIRDGGSFFHSFKSFDGKKLRDKHEHFDG